MQLLYYECNIYALCHVHNFFCSGSLGEDIDGELFLGLTLESMKKELPAISAGQRMKIMHVIKLFTFQDVPIEVEMVRKRFIF